MIDIVTSTRTEPWGYRTRFEADVSDKEWDRWMAVQRRLFSGLCRTGNAVVVGWGYYRDQTSSELQSESLNHNHARSTRLTGWVGHALLDQAQLCEESVFIQAFDQPIESMIDLDYAISVASLMILVEYSGPNDLDQILLDLGEGTSSEAVVERVLGFCREIVWPNSDGEVTEVLSRADATADYLHEYEGPVDSEG